MSETLTYFWVINTKKNEENERHPRDVFALISVRNCKTEFELKFMETKSKCDFKELLSMEYSHIRVWVSEMPTVNWKVSADRLRKILISYFIRYSCSKKKQLNWSEKNTIDWKWYKHDSLDQWITINKDRSYFLGTAKRNTQRK